MKNKHIVHFSIDSNCEYCIVLEVLDRYRLLRFFVIDTTQESLEVFLRDYNSKLDLSGVATVLNLKDIQVEQKNIYRYKLSPPEDSERFSRSFMMFVVMEPILGGHKRCELYDVAVSRSKRGNLVIPVNPFRPKNPKMLSSALTEDVSSENMEIILTCALKRPLETVIHSKTLETLNHAVPKNVPDNVTGEVSSPEVPQNSDVRPVEQESIANKHADTPPETISDKHEEATAGGNLDMLMKTESLEESHQLEQFAFSPPRPIEIFSPKMIPIAKGKDEEYEALLRENNKLVILLVIFMFLFAIVLTAFVGYILVIHSHPRAYP